MNIVHTRTLFGGWTEEERLETEGEKYEFLYAARFTWLLARTTVVYGTGRWAELALCLT